MLVFKQLFTFLKCAVPFYVKINTTRSKFVVVFSVKVCWRHNVCCRAWKCFESWSNVVTTRL